MSTPRRRWLVCSLEEGLMPINFYACNFIGRLACHDFEGITVRAEEGERLLANLADKNILMLRNHGPVVMAKSLQTMFVQQWALQRACEIQMATLSMGRPPIMISQNVIDVHQRDLSMATPPAAGRAWAISTPGRGGSTRSTGLGAIERLADGRSGGLVGSRHGHPYRQQPAHRDQARGRYPAAVGAARCR